MEKTAVIVSHTHWDREWYLPFEVFRIRLVRLVDRLLEILEKDPLFHSFTLDGQAVVLEDYLEIRPETEGRLRKLIGEGKIKAGPWYVLPDEFLVSGEALVRNLLIGHRVVKEIGGGGTRTGGRGGETLSVMRVGYLPDPFGHIAQMPQILQGFGIRSAIFTRGIGDHPPSAEYIWEGVDGSQVLAVHQVTGYENAGHLPLSPKGCAERVALEVERLSPFVHTPFLLLNNGGDHLEPQEGLPTLLKEAQPYLKDIALLHSSFEQYLEMISPYASAFPHIEGELRGSRFHPILSGVLSTRIYLKQANFYSQILVEKVLEPLCTLAYLHGYPYPSRWMKQIWKLLLKNHPHDSICGCSIDDVALEMLGRYGRIEQIARRLIHQALSFLESRGARHRSTKETRTGEELDEATMQETGMLPGYPFTLPPLSRIEGGRVMAWNLLPFWRDGLVRGIFYLAEGQEDEISSLSVQGEKGKGSPLQILWSRARDPRELNLQGAGKGRVLEVEGIFYAGSVPPLGYAEFRLTRKDRSTGSSDPGSAAPHAAEGGPLNEVPYPVEVDQGGKRARNGLVELQVRPDGSVSMMHFSTGQTFGPFPFFEDMEDAGDEYDFSPAESSSPRYFPCHPLDSRSHQRPGFSQSSSRKPSLYGQWQSTGPLSATFVTASLLEIPVSLAEGRKRRSEETAGCSVATFFTLYAGVEGVEMRIRFSNRALDHRLRILFPLPFPVTSFFTEGGFAVLAREPANPGISAQRAVKEGMEGWRQIPPRNVPVSGFIDFPGHGGGLSIFPGGIPEWEVWNEGGGALAAATLLRSVGWLGRDDLLCRPYFPGPMMATPGAQCPGAYEFLFFLFPHKVSQGLPMDPGSPRNGQAACLTGQSVEGRVIEEFQKFQVPLLGRIREEQGSCGGVELLRWEESFEISPTSLVVTAWKKCEERNGVILRVYNPYPRSVQMSVRSKRLKKGWILNLLEQREDPLPVKDRTITLVVDKGKIITLELS